MADSPPLKRAARAEWVVLTLLLSAACVTLGLVNGLGRPDATLYDFLLTSSDRAPPQDVVIIAIDDRSLAAIGRWPWPRAVHTRMLGVLAEARPRALGLDLIEVAYLSFFCLWVIKFSFQFFTYRFKDSD